MFLNEYCGGNRNCKACQQYFPCKQQEALLKHQDTQELHFANIFLCWSAWSNSSSLENYCTTQYFSLLGIRGLYFFIKQRFFTKMHIQLIFFEVPTVWDSSCTLSSKITITKKEHSCGQKFVWWQTRSFHHRHFK